MKKILFFIMSAIFIVSFAACGEKELSEAEAREKAFKDNMYIDEAVVDKNGNKVSLYELYGGGYMLSEYIDDREDIGDYNEKSGYYVDYKIHGHVYFNQSKQSDSPFSTNAPFSQLGITIFKNNGKVIFFNYKRRDDELSKNTDCDVFVSENKMTSACGDKEGEVVNKILNAIENKTYFDY